MDNSNTAASNVIGTGRHSTASSDVSVKRPAPVDADSGIVAPCKCPRMDTEESQPSPNARHPHPGQGSGSAGTDSVQLAPGRAGTNMTPAPLQSMTGARVPAAATTITSPANPRETGQALHQTPQNDGSPAAPNPNHPTPVPYTVVELAQTPRFDHVKLALDALFRIGLPRGQKYMPPLRRQVLADLEEEVLRGCLSIVHCGRTPGADPSGGAGTTLTVWRGDGFNRAFFSAGGRSFGGCDGRAMARQLPGRPNAAADGDASTERARAGDVDGGAQRTGVADAADK